MINMLKPFKLNTINFSSEIFSPAPHNTQPKTNNCNKRFKYGYRKNLSNQGSSRKERSFTIDLVHTTALQELNKLQQDIPIAINQQQQQRRKNASHQTYINNFIFQGSKYIKHTQPQAHSKSTCFGHRKIRSDCNEHSPKYGSETHNRAAMERAEEEPQVVIKEEKPQAKIAKLPQKENHTSSKPATERKPRSAPKSKRMNSILQSYKVKSIKLANPLSPPVPYYIDLANEQNLHEIHFQDIEKIQLQRVKYESRRTFSHNNCKNRPLTSKPASKPDDFQPRPWQSQQREQMTSM